MSKGWVKPPTDVDLRLSDFLEHYKKQRKKRDPEDAKNSILFVADGVLSADDVAELAIRMDNMDKAWKSDLEDCEDVAGQT